MRSSRIVLLSLSLSFVACRMPVDRVDPMRELEIVDPSVVGDARATNAAYGPWSFRGAVVALAGSDVEAAEIVHDTLVRLGPEAEAKILCPWLRADPANACDVACRACARRSIDLAGAPFRLVAISNRLDLVDDPDARAAEVRLLYAITNGPADEASSTALPATVTFEYHLPPTRTTAEWAKAWHALGTLEGATYRDALARLLAEGTRGLAQIRTNLGGQMNELAFDRAAKFRPQPFDAAKCAACHGGEHPAVDGVFHVSPLREGAARLSPFVTTDLHRREDSLRSWL